jgi:hypothetical protein
MELGQPDFFVYRDEVLESEWGLFTHRVSKVSSFGYTTEQTNFDDTSEKL